MNNNNTTHCCTNESSVSLLVGHIRVNSPTVQQFLHVQEVASSRHLYQLHGRQLQRTARFEPRPIKLEHLGSEQTHGISDELGESDATETNQTSTLTNITNVAMVITERNSTLFK